MTQLDFPFPFEDADLKKFLTVAHRIENDMDRLREEQRFLRQDFATALPLRAVQTALKVVRARRKLANHAKEPMTLMHQKILEAEVDRHLDHLETEEGTDLDLQQKERAMPDMVTLSGAGRSVTTTREQFNRKVRQMKRRA